MTTTKLASYSFPCLVATQGKFNLVCFKTSAKLLWKFVTVNRRESDKDIGYQRALSNSRVNSLRKFIENGNPIPNSILISLDHGKLSENNSILTIPNKEDMGWVIDGQHRLAGAHEASKDIEVFVIAFLKLEEDAQINQFVVINREAKGVPTSLYLDLLKHLPAAKSDADASKERAVDIADALKKTIKSPLYQKIVIESPQKGEISLTNFVRKVSPLVVDKKGKFHTYTLTEQIGILDNYFMGLNEVFPKEFQFSRSTFLKTLGFGAVINSLPTVFDLTLKECHAFRVEDVIKTLNNVDYYDFSMWDNYGTGTAAELQAGEDFRQELLKSLSNQGPESSSLKL